MVNHTPSRLDILSVALLEKETSHWENCRLANDTSHELHGDACKARYKPVLTSYLIHKVSIVYEGHLTELVLCFLLCGGF